MFAPYSDDELYAEVVRRARATLTPRPLRAAGAYDVIPQTLSSPAGAAKPTVSSPAGAKRRGRGPRTLALLGPLPSPEPVIGPAKAGPVGLAGNDRWGGAPD